MAMPLCVILSASIMNHLTPARVHLVDAYPRGNPTNFLFRGNNPTDEHAVDGKMSRRTFNLTNLLDTARGKAGSECSITLPNETKVFDLDLENPTDPGFFAEVLFWKEHSSLGQVGTPSLPGTWETLGSVLEPKYCPSRDAFVRNGSWAIQGHADHLEARLNATRALLEDTSGPPKLLYAHCNAGCDRTGEFIAAYAMTFLKYNVTTAYGEACKQCGRCPNYYATTSIGWWCLTLQARGRRDLGDCLEFAGCKFLGDCHPHNGTALADDCPR